MKDAEYSNYDHYIADGWHKDPKKIFVFLADYLDQLEKVQRQSILDVGCATGELIGYLHHRFPDVDMSGIDMFDLLLSEAQKFVPNASFAQMSGLSLPGDFAGKFDVVTAVGVLDIFDHDESVSFVQGMMGSCRPGGQVLILSPFNEFGMDMNTRHRKWSKEKAGDWERGNNIYAMETIRQFAGPDTKVSFLPFNIGMEMQQQEDPQRTWTIELPDEPYQLVNGLKLMMNLYLCIIEVQ